MSGELTATFGTLTVTRSRASFERVDGSSSLVLSDGDSEGHAPLHEAMRQCGCSKGSPRPFGAGFTQCMTLVAQSLAEPGDEIIVEVPTYPVMRETLVRGIEGIRSAVASASAG